MASSTRYHLLPEETGRPSIETLDDSRPLISPSIPQDHKVGFKSIHPTAFLRFLAFVLHLAGAIVLGTRGLSHNGWGANNDVIPSIVFLSFALARNFYVLSRHLFSKFVKISLTLHVEGLGKRESGCKAWLRGKVLQFVIDATIIFCLFIVLPIGRAKVTDRWGWSQSQEVQGYAVALAGMPPYVFAIVDFGQPASVTLSAYLTYKGKKKDTDEPDTPQMEYRDVEAQLPEPEAERTAGEEGDHILV